MRKERTMALVGRKVTFAEEELETLLQWQKVAFEEKWKSLERLRKLFYSVHEKPFPRKMKKEINIRHGWS